jgi:hypothetical protein
VMEVPKFDAWDLGLMYAYAMNWFLSGAYAQSIGCLTHDSKITN